MKRCNHSKGEIKSGGHRIALEDLEKTRSIFPLFSSQFNVKRCTDVAYINATSSTAKEPFSHVINFIHEYGYINCRITNLK